MTAVLEPVMFLTRFRWLAVTPLMRLHRHYWSA